MNSEIDQAVEIIKGIQEKEGLKLYVLTGAGVSKGSGVPTFRGKDGLWEQFDIEEIASLGAWLRNPTKIWGFYVQGIQLILDAKPNPAHIAIAELEKHGLCQYVVTQNADSLHQKAGSKNIIELHGNLLRARCTKCRSTRIFDAPPKEIPPICDCGNIFRPDVVLFDEILPQEAIQKAFKVAKKSNVSLVIGTSATVYPAANLPFISKKRKAKIIVFNPEKTDHARVADVFVRGKCEETVPVFVEKLLQKA